VKLTQREDIKIGMYFTMCCHNDIDIVTENTDIDEIFEFGIRSYDFWGSKLEALEEIKTWFENGLIGSSKLEKDLKEINSMIETEK